MFLVQNFFFNNINLKIFERKYFSHFIYEEYLRGSTIFNENENNKYIYFLKDGDVEITINKSLLEIHNLVKVLIDSGTLTDENEFNLKNGNII
jgi:hypothetical protein